MTKRQSLDVIKIIDVVCMEHEGLHFTQQPKKSK